MRGTILTLEWKSPGGDLTLISQGCRGTLLIFFFPFCCLSCVPFTLVPTYLQRYAEPWPQSRMCPLAVLNLTFKAERLIPGLELKGRTGPESCHLWTLHVTVILRHTPPTGGLKLPSRCGLRREAQPGARIMAGRWAESSCGRWLLELVWKTKYIWQCCVRAGVLGRVPSLQPRGPQPTRLLCPWNFPATILERVAISYSRGSSRPRDRTQVSGVSCIGRWILTTSTTWTTLWR